MDCRSGHTDPMTEAFLQMAGVFSQLELAMIRARVRSGMANASDITTHKNPESIGI
ncbi:MAG: recombinase family protein [Oscillospiraceae bacterium]|nr:recombinase family protein [Oscillospiraceae bacterium]